MAKPYSYDLRQKVIQAIKLDRPNISFARQEGKMIPGNQGNTKGDGLYKYNPAVEKIRTSFQNSEVAQLKAFSSST